MTILQTALKHFRPQARLFSFNMSKTITIFGATGNQGGSIINAILGDKSLSQEYKVRGVTRDTSKSNAQALAKKGVEVVSADMRNKDSMVKVLQASDSVFIVTNFWETMKVEDELLQGKNAVDAAKEAGVKQILFSSLINVSKATNGRLSHVSHFDGKAEIEDYIRATGITATFVQAGYFMSNMNTTIRKGEDGSYSFAFPLSREAQFPLLDVPVDYGRFALPALRDPAKWNGKKILAAAKYYTINEIISDFEEATGKKLNYAQLEPEQFKGFLPPNIAQEVLENHLLLDGPGYWAGASLQESLDAIEGKPETWKAYVAKTDVFKQ